MNITYEKLAPFLLYAMCILWAITVFSTLYYWLTGLSIPTNTRIDLTVVTIILMVAFSVNALQWPLIYIVYLLNDKKIIQHQSLLIRNRKPNENHALVSIIIPARNEESVIRKTILTCLQQTYKRIEVIVVCHNSTDRTFVESNVNDLRVKAFDLKTQEAGKGIALNFGVKHARGDLICVLDSDGKLSPDFIANIVPIFDEGYAAAQGQIVASNRRYNLITAMLSLEGELFSTPYEFVRHFLVKKAALGGTGCIIRKDVLIKVGKFGNALIDDFELSFRLFRNGYKIAYAPLSIVYDEKPPTLEMVVKQRSRWIKGHIDLLKHRTAEPKDIMGIIYWLSPIFMMCGLASFAIAAFAVLHFYLLGHYPYLFSYLPVQVWIISSAVSFLLQMKVLRRHRVTSGYESVLHAALLIPFSYYWYVVLLKSFFVKSWDNTKTIHGFELQEVKQVIKQTIAILAKADMKFDS